MTVEEKDDKTITPPATPAVVVTPPAPPLDAVPGAVNAPAAAAATTPPPARDAQGENNREQPAAKQEDGDDPTLWYDSLDESTRGRVNAWHERQVTKPEWSMLHQPCDD